LTRDDVSLHLSNILGDGDGSDRGSAEGEESESGAHGVSCRRVGGEEWK